MTINPKWQPLIDVFLATNQKINLSAIRDPEAVYVKHILDSLELINVIDFDKIPGSRIADVGTWGGFPLLPLAMSLPDMQFVGIDSVAKKLQAIQDMCSELSIQNVTLLWDRIEYMKKTFDIVTARAVAHIEKLLPRVHNLLRPGSLLILYKEAKSDEYQIMLRLLPQFDLKLIKEHRYSLFEWDIVRVIYVLEKLAKPNKK